MVYGMCSDTSRSITVGRNLFPLDEDNDIEVA